MELGAFSVSLNVKDIHKSKGFYENLGFTVLGGDINQNWLIMKNGDAVIGLFQGMFEKNILTFNPGWNQSAQTLDDYVDVRKIHEATKKAGIATEQVKLDGVSGPGSFVFTDPDGNHILIDQHV